MVNSNLLQNKYKKYFTKYLSVKLHKSLLNFKSLKTINTVRFFDFDKFFHLLIYKYKLKVYYKHICFVRYLDHFLIGVVGSCNFLRHIQLKVTNFTRSNLHIFFRSLSAHFYNEPCAFLGFKIVMSFSPIKNIFSFSTSKLKKKYEKRIFSRLNAIKAKLSSICVKRFNVEMMEFFNLLLENKKLTNLSIIDKRIWMYLFQLEAIRSAQFGQLIFTINENNFFPENFFSSIRSENLKILNYKLYSFNLFITKMQTVLQKLVLDSSIFLNTSVLPLDLFFSKLNTEYAKKAILFLETFSFSKERLNSGFYSLENSLSFMGSYPLKQEIKSMKLNISLVKQKSSLQIRIPKLFLVVPLEFLIKKLIFLGFIHPFKKRPIGNTKYILLDDKAIIIAFGYFANVLLFWYRCCDDFEKIKMIILMLRKSCLLTLCRKHNKNKSWGLRIYTSDLIYIRSSFYNKCFFPLSSYVKSLSKKFLLKNSFDALFFNEALFLT